MGDFRTDRPELYERVLELIPSIEGRPCLCVYRYFDFPVFHCRRVYDLHIDNYGVVTGLCDWVEPIETRPDELTELLRIGYDCLEVGPGWWYDNYFGRWYVFDDELVRRSLLGDDSWVEGFKSARSPPAA
jgi:hypothetical protein